MRVTRKRRSPKRERTREQMNHLRREEDAPPLTHPREDLFHKQTADYRDKGKTKTILCPMKTFLYVNEQILHLLMNQLALSCTLQRKFPGLGPIITVNLVNITSQ